MKIINPEVILETKHNEYDTLAKKIETIGRVCYKSEKRITKTTAKPFVRKLINMGHESVLEHGVLIFRTGIMTANFFERIISRHTGDKFSHIYISTFIDNLHDGKHHVGIISGNIRAWRNMIKHLLSIEYYAEYNYNAGYHLLSMMLRDDRIKIFFEDILSAERIDSFNEKLYQRDETIKTLINNMTLITPEDLMKMPLRITHKHLPISIRFITDRGISHELVRHRIGSYSQESTRYVKYDDIEVVRPSEFYADSAYFKKIIRPLEAAYNELIENGMPPQIARAILPTCLKTEIVATMRLCEWNEVFKLRTAKGAHPDMRNLMEYAQLLLTTYLDDKCAELRKEEDDE